MGDILAEDDMWDLLDIIDNGTALFRRTEAPYSTRMEMGGGFKTIIAVE